ncbi:MAG TPA: hypothetical protein VEO56_09150 [Bacteroidota bacterium]|nr:hypothetical protein [Bacteroidota bacterium]
MIDKMPQEDANGYIAAVLKIYLQLPETPTRSNFNDRKTAEALLTRGVPLTTIESALLLATVRRLGRPSDLPPLSPIRSLAYFMPVVQELVNDPIPEDYLQYLRMKVRFLATK